MNEQQTQRTRHHVVGRVVLKQIKCVEADCPCGKHNVLVNPDGAGAVERGQEIVIPCGGCGDLLVMANAPKPRIKIPQIVLAKR